MSLLRRVGLALAAPVLALAFALVVTSVVLAISGAAPLATFQAMVEYGVRPRSLALTLNSATAFYLAAVAVAIGFRMNLFNIGVDGQYRIAALAAASVGGAVALPQPLHVGLILVVGMAVGGLWAAIPALLKVYRGVSEVIATIMLNAIAGFLIAFLLQEGRLGEKAEGSNTIATPEIPESGAVPGLPLVPGSPLHVYGLIVVAVLVGVAYWFVLGRTRFGFDLRATGMSESAAVASGVSVKRMVVTSMVLSGAVAGLIGLPQLLGGTNRAFGQDFPAGIGFTGIAIALLGRNHPVGIAFAAALWAFLNSSAQILDLNDVSPDIVQITQAVIVLSVVVAYEVVRRYRVTALQREVGRQLARAAADRREVSA